MKPPAKMNPRAKKAGRPAGLTAAAKSKRDKKITHDRVIGDMSWTGIALKYDLDERSCQRAVESYKGRNQNYGRRLHERFAGATNGATKRYPIRSAGRPQRGRGSSRRSESAPQ